MAKKEVGTTKRKVTKFNALQKAVAARCKNKTAANDKKVKKAKEAYVEHAVSKGKTVAEARKSANKADTCNPFGKKK